MRKTKRLTVLALLTAASLCVFVIEAQFPPLTSIPGIKPGLSNIFTLVTFHTLGPVSACLLLLVRILLGSVITGQVSAMGYSLIGGLLSYLVLLFLKKLPVNQLWAASVLCAAAHNTGQLLLAVFVLGSRALFWYLPILILSAMVTGAFTGITSGLLLQRLRHNILTGDDFDVS